MEKIFAIVAMIISYYAIGGMATTNIMRLLKGETAKQNDIHCRCGNCHTIIPVYHQFPFFSIWLSKGRCRTCGVVIPPLNTVIEISVGLFMTIISALFSFRPIGVVMSFLAYELFRVGMLIKFGHREQDFVKEYIIAVLYMLLAFAMVLFMSFLSTLA